MSLILLCAATGLEAAVCRKAIERAGAKGRCEVLRTGMGLRRAREALEARLSRGTRPDWVISTGFAGCRSVTPRIGQWAFARSVALDSGRRLELREAAPPFFARESGTALETDVVSVSSVEIFEEESAEGAARPTLVDMESFAWADVARVHNIRFQVLRMISDTPERPLPVALGHLVSASTAVSWRARATAALRAAHAAATDVGGMARFVRSASGLAGLMTDGWAGFLAHPELVPFRVDERDGSPKKSD